MKKTILTMPAIVLLVSILGSCTSPTRNVELAKEEVSDAKGDLKKAKQEYRDDMKMYKELINARIDANRESIKTLREKGVNFSADARIDYKAKIDELETKNRELDERLLEYHDEGIESWNSFKAELDRDMDKLGKTLADFTIKNK